MWWKCCERSAASTVTTAFCLSPFLCGVAADGRVSSRWPLWCHTFWQDVCSERLVFPSLHSCLRCTVLALRCLRPLRMFELWWGDAVFLFFFFRAERHRTASGATAMTALKTSSQSTVWSNQKLGQEVCWLLLCVTLCAKGLNSLLILHKNIS